MRFSAGINPAARIVTDDMKHLALILALSATVMLTGLGSSRLWDDDEPRNAGCAREMLARGDWIVPTFNAELRAHKPVLTYWCLMVSYLLLGESEFSARLPSALAAIGTTLLTYSIGRKLFSPQAALWAALILPTTMLFAMAGRIATPDSLLIFCVTLTMAVFVWTAWPHEIRRVGPAAEPRRPTEMDADSRWVGACRGELDPPYGFSWWQAAAIYAAMGLAVLAKGPVGLVLPTAIVGMFLLIAGWRPATITASVSAGKSTTVPRLRAGLLSLGRLFPHFIRTTWSMRPLTALAMVGLIAGPWYLAVGYQTDWRFLEEFFIDHNVRRATGAMEGHTGGIWFYPAMLLVGFFPWSIFAIPVALDAAGTLKRHSREQTATIFLLCWIGVWLGAFTLASTKLPSYATPCFPAVALLAGRFVERVISGRLALSRFWPLASFGCLIAVGLAASYALPQVAEKYLPGEEWLGTLGIIPAAGGVVALICWRLNWPERAAASLVASSALLVLGIFALGAHVADRHQESHRLLAPLRHSAGPIQVASFKVLEPSWVYYGRRPIRELAGPRAGAAAFLAAGPDRYLITSERHWERIRQQGGVEGVIVLVKTHRFLKGEPLVLVGRAPEKLSRRREQGDLRPR